jgi:hypothetical protein
MADLLRGKAVIFSVPDLTIGDIKRLFNYTVRYLKKEGSLDLEALITCSLWQVSASKGGL